MKKYGIIGYPLAQSASPAFFNGKFEKEGIDARYIPFEIESIDELPRIIEEHPELQGFNVTIPHKIAVMQYLEGMSDEAKGINAVNVVKVTHDADGKAHLWGYNSDVIGFSRSIEPLLQGKHSKALILGTGGASKAITYALEKLGIECLYSAGNGGPWRRQVPRYPLRPAQRQPPALRHRIQPRKHTVPAEGRRTGSHYQKRLRDVVPSGTCLLGNLEQIKAR